MADVDLFAPLSSLRWVDRDQLKPNDYNPNKVNRENLKLLVQSILTNGWTLPIVVRPDYTIIDGFHRWTVAGEEPLHTKLGGKVPVVIVRHDDQTEDIYGTVTHNRARGTHLLEPMKAIVKPSLFPRVEQRFTWKEKLVSLKNLIPIAIVAVVIIGGIFFGICSSAEAGAIGCLVFFLMGLIKRTPFRKIWRSIMDTVENMTMLFLILACSGMFAKFMTVSGLAQALTNLVTQAHLSPIVFMVAAVVVFLILGCFLDAYSSIALTIPVFYPAAVALGIDPMQFDLVAILALHMGGLTPPVGLCVYSVKAVAPKDVDVMGIFKGSMPYLAVMIVITLLFIFIPGLSTFIPNAMFT